MHRRRAFTLVELLVVIAIIGVLVALLLPAVQQARESARRSLCVNKMKQWGVALANYADTNGILPVQSTFMDSGQGVTNRSWMVHLLPYIDQQAIYDRMNMERSGVVAPNLAAIQRPLGAAICPSDPLGGVVGFGAEVTADLKIAQTNYAGSVGDHLNGAPQGEGEQPPYGQRNASYPSATAASWTRGVMGRCGFSARPREVTDGLSKTIFVGEVVGFWCGWHNWGHQSWATTAHPVNTFNAIAQSASNQENVLTPGQCIIFRSHHLGGANFLFGDGAVRFLNEAMDGAAYRALSSRSEGEIVEL
ncbi:hypothetical protein Pan216_30570 [Planctomycetes bacterium Pan216]|uniref:DUF1559 domain-containing protein n=1 Tax=Kolteria novifilia TaxID=2527975 RepID=A0A518B5E1_9BACT|nr:hypothetical protein Pan216_30570 [Planctomycetes bacterium Pan216]